MAEDGAHRHRGRAHEALNVAVTSLGRKRGGSSNDRLHRFAAAASGAAGGAFGIAAIGIELPLSTTLILRSIAEIAAAEGEDPRQIETKLACITVFALGSTKDQRDNAAESGYFAARAALASAVSEATKFLAEKGLGKSGAPALVRLIALIASRFGVVVSQKAAAQMVPVIGAAGAPSSTRSSSALQTWRGASRRGWRRSTARSRCGRLREGLALRASRPREAGKCSTRRSES